MKHKLLSVALLIFSSVAIAQSTGSFWNATTKKSDKIALDERIQLPENHVFELNLNGLRSSLNAAPKRTTSGQSQNILSLPTASGTMARFKVYENAIMEPELAARYPEIKSYIGIGIDNPTATVYFSVSPLGFKAMVLSADKSAEFIEPITQDLTTYTVYRKSDKAVSLTPFECSVIDVIKPTEASTTMLRPNADDAILRTFRLAMSVTGEYTAYFGGTKALALAAINNTMTRVNGIFEKDFGARMVLIANTDAVIYTNASTDPYSAASTGAGGAWNTELQNTLTSVIGNAAYDIGHLFGASGGGGNAGCIGCICVDDTSSTTDKNKGSGFTSPADGIPAGDNFDVDYVAHEMGHQFGANHTFTHSNEGTGVQMEPGSGSTIMGYAGITTKDVQAHSDAYFHAVSIQQVTNNLKTKTCSVNTSTGNSVPVVNAGLDYTIPKSTPFMLTGTATDANGDALTYNWEQMDNQTTSAVPSATKTSGVNYRSYTPTTSPTRYFPRMQSVLTGATTTSGSELVVEALSSVARTQNFRFTARDNRAGGSANNSDDMVLTVNATAGPFTVSSPNTAVSYVGGSTQTVTWAVAGTTANGVNCANVDILLSTDGGNNWTTILAATPNDGSQAVTIPNTPSSTCRIMVKGTNHIFFDVSNTNFTITAGTAPDTTAPTAPTLTASGTTQTTTNLSWSGATDNVGVTGYDVYRGATLLGSTAATSYAVTGLTPSTAYSFTVRAKDAAGNVSVASNTVNVTTLAPVADTTAPTAPTLSASGTTSSSTNLSWTGATDNVGVTGYDVYQGATLLGSTASTTYAVTGLSASTAYSFTVRAKDAAGNVSVSSNTASVTTLAVTISYCASQGNSIADEYIGRVQLGTINNATGGVTGYVDYTSLSTDLTKNTAYTITITPTWTGSTYSEGYAVFIDYNQDGDFADAGETVWSAAASTTTPVSGTFTVPSSATSGATRMRVSMKYNGVPTSCETFSYGQVEDYTVNLVNATADTQAPTVPTSLTASGTTQTTTTLTWNASTDNVAVTGYEVFLNGSSIGTVTTTSSNITGLTPSTAYSFTVRAFDAAGNNSAMSNVANVTTLSATNNASDLLFSEYVEGSSNNKALEIANNTGSAVNMSIYSIKKQTNGAGSWGTALTLSGTLNDGAKFVIVHSSINSTCYSAATANISTSGVQMTYNGNDPVGLFKNNVLIDIIGTFNGGSANFGADVTLRRKSSVTSPTTTFNLSAEWDAYASDTCGGIGNKVDVAQGAAFSQMALYPNPVAGNILNISNIDGEATYSIFNLLGQQLGKGTVTNNAVAVGHLKAGAYLIEVTTDGETQTKRFIKE
jgi:chitodextrinase